MDSNFPPDTWITAAPQDTLTTRDESGNPVRPQPGTIPFRFHLYWSGSDQDGAVSGFYWAVVETVGSVGLPMPPLPGPKPQDYRYTSVRDSVFIFNVFEETNNRQHAFYIYAVDNKGKPDATPARVIFNTLDRFPPIPIIDPDSRATGRIFHPNQAWNGMGQPPVEAPIETTIVLRDTLDPQSLAGRRTPPSDFVPIGSVVSMKWHSEITVADNPAVFYKYKIGEGEEVEFVQVPASVTHTEYNTTDRNRLGPGLKVFTLRAIDQAGGARSSPQTTRRFYMNLLPDTWFAGPDSIPQSNPSFYTVVRYKDENGGPNGRVKERYRSMNQGTSANWTTAFPGSLLHPDSVQTMPASRKPNKTFFEIYTEYNYTTNVPQNRIYVHGEGDTIHMNSWVLLHGGGFDADSPYSLRILVSNPALPGIGTTPVLTSGPANGSPIGFRFRIPAFLDSIGPETTFPQSQVFPLSDPAVVAEPHIGGYQGMQLSGRAYAIMRSQDGSGGVDNRIEDPVAFVDSIEKGLIGPGHPRYPLKDKVLTFYVNRAPYLLRDDPTFEPKPGQTYFTRQIKLTLGKVADDDPYDRNQRSVGGSPGGTPTARVYRFSVLLRGKVAGSNPPRDTVYAPAQLRRVWQNVPPEVTLDVPSYIAGPQVAVEIEVCDCKECEVIPGEGRCRRYPPINVIVPAVTAMEPSASPSSIGISSTGPGSSGKSSRSRTP